MAVFIDPRTGERYENVPDDQAARARSEFGLVPEAEYQHSQQVEQAGEGTTLQAAGEAAQRVVGGVAEGIQQATGFGTAPGLEELPGGGLGALQEAYSPEARLRREAHPLAAGIGTGLAVAPAAGLAAAGAAAALPGATIPLLGGSAAGLATESAVQAAAQEYDDAWFEQRPFELQGVAAKTLMFATGDLLFRGALQGGKRLLFGAPKESAGLGRNIISEAQGAARELSPDLAPAGGGGSVGAARAADLSEPFDDAIRSMSDKDAAVLARDAEDHLHLVSQSASEGFTRINQGLTDNLGNKLKYQDFAANAADWDAPLLERQSAWLDGMIEQGEAVTKELSAFGEGRPTAYDFRNMGKRAVKTIEQFNQRLATETDPARRNYLADQYKKQLDAITMAADAGHGDGDFNVMRDEFKKLIAPLREELRAGLQNPKFWGENAELQRALNGPWHQFLEHWPKVQRDVLEATGHVAFDQSGAGRITRESTVDRMRAVLSKDPRSSQEFARHLAGAFDGLQGLIEARQARGITNTGGLEAMAADVRNLMEDWNLATTVGVAKNRVAIMKRDPRKWASLALDLGERLPIVGKPIQVGRNLGEAFTDLHLKQGTPLAAVWERGYQRYAKNPAFADPSIARNYADWVIDALRGRGGAVPPPAGAAPVPAVPEGSLFGAPQRMAASAKAPAQRVREIIERRRSQSGSIALELLVGDRGAALEGASAAEARGILTGKEVPGETVHAVSAVEPGVSGEPGALVQSARGVPRNLPPVPKADVFTPHVGSVAHEGFLSERLSGPLGKTPGGFFRGKDGVIRYIKADKDAAHTAVELGNISMYRALGVETPQWHPLELPDGTKALYSEFLGSQWRDLNDIPDWSQLPQSVRDSYAEQVPKDIILGNWDVSRNARNVMTDGERVLMVDAGEATINAHAAGWFRGNYPHTSAEIQRTVGYGKGRRLLTAPKDFEGKAPPHELLLGYAPNKGQLSAIVQKGYDDALARIEAAGGVDAFVTQHQPNLSDGQRKILAEEMRNRINWLKPAIPILGTALFLAFSGRAEAAERPPPPLTSPEHAYRDALREISQAGDAQIASLASSVLRARGLKPGKKGPLELFAGRRSLDDAVDSARQRLGALAGDPSQLVRELAGSVGDLAKTHPAVYSALVAKAAQITQYLRASLDPPAAVTLMDPRGGKLSFDRAWDFAARTVGAAYPRTALKEIARGTAPPEMIEAVRQNWPELWEPFRAELLGQVQRMAAAGKHLPSEKLLRLDRQLGMDGQLDPSASMAVAAHFLAAQDAEQAKRQQAGQAGGGRALSSSSGPSYRTTLDSIRSERTLQ